MSASYSRLSVIAQGECGVDVRQRSIESARLLQRQFKHFIKGRYSEVTLLVLLCCDVLTGMGLRRFYVQDGLLSFKYLFITSINIKEKSLRSVIHHPHFSDV